jgi:hypothetical protein
MEGRPRRAKRVYPRSADGALATVSEAGLVDAIYNLWDRNPITVRASYVRSEGKQDQPPAATLASY